MLATLLTQYYADGSIIPLSDLTAIRDRFGRQPFIYIELDIDYCGNVYGVAPCTASIPTTGDDKCYNTLITCQDRPNYALQTKTYRYCQANGGSVPAGLDAIPCLAGVSLTPAVIDTGNGLGLRALASATFTDFPHSDIRVDPYVSGRAYIPLAQGTYWGKFRARNPYYNGRVMRIYSGYLTDSGAFDPALFEKKTYFIESFEGVTAQGTVTIGAKDILSLAGDDRAVYPRPSVGKLTLDISDSATTATITPVGVGDLDYAPSGFVRVGSEVMAYTRSGDNLTLTRAQGGTNNTSHKVGDTVQQCAWFNADKVQDILYELMTVGANINAAYIPKAEWDTEQTAYLPRLYSALITAPTGVSKLIAELAEQIGFFMFWDEVGEKIRFKAIRPNAGTDAIYELTAERDILADSLSLKDLADARVNEVWVYYGVIDTTKNLTEEANYKVIHVSSNVADQSVSQSNDLRIKKIFSRWISGLNGSAATELANRYIKRYARAPREVSLRLDAKDAAITLADFVQVQSRQSQDFSGANQPLLLQVTKRTESKQGTSYDITAREFAYDDTDFDTGLRVIEVNSDVFDLNIRDAYDAIYADAPDGKTVRLIVASGVLVTSSNAADPLGLGALVTDPEDTRNYAINFGAWPVDTTLEIVVNGIASGRGGRGGGYFGAGGAGDEKINGVRGGRGILVTRPVSITVNSGGKIAGGGGGGGAAFVNVAWSSGVRLANGGGGAPFGAKGYLHYGAPDTAQNGGRLIGGLGDTSYEGGKGGDIGVVGGVATPGPVGSRGAGGAIGKAIHDPSGFATIINNGQIVSG